MADPARCTTCGSERAPRWQVADLARRVLVSLLYGEFPRVEGAAEARALLGLCWHENDEECARAREGRAT